MKLQFILSAIFVSAIYTSDDMGDLAPLPFIQHAYPSQVYLDLELEERLKIHALEHGNIKEDAFTHLLVIKECRLREQLNKRFNAERNPNLTEEEIRTFQNIIHKVDSARAAEPILSNLSEKEKDKKRMLKNIFNFFKFESTVFSENNNKKRNIHDHICCSCCHPFNY